MNKAPAIGDRVIFMGRPSLGPCVGVVVSVYKSRVWAVDENGEEQETHTVAPESEWSVVVLADERPSPWPYPMSLVPRFAAEVKLVEPIEKTVKD